MCFEGRPCLSRRTRPSPLKALGPVPDGDIWIDGHQSKLPPAAPGDVFVFNLASNPIADLRSPFDFHRWSSDVSCPPRGIAYERQARRHGASASARRRLQRAANDLTTGIAAVCRLRLKAERESDCARCARVPGLWPCCRSWSFRSLSRHSFRASPRTETIWAKDVGVATTYVEEMPTYQAMRKAAQTHVA
jgi:hypothetical protein